MSDVQFLSTDCLHFCHWEIGGCRLDPSRNANDVNEREGISRMAGDTVRPDSVYVGDHDRHIADGYDVEVEEKNDDVGQGM